MAFEQKEVFPNGIPIARDGFGNFWVLDLTPQTAKTAPVFFACHDAPVILYQSSDIASFLTEVFRMSTPFCALITEPGSRILRGSSVHYEQLTNWRSVRFGRRDQRTRKRLFSETSLPPKDLRRPQGSNPLKVINDCQSLIKRWGGRHSVSLIGSMIGFSAGLNSDTRGWR
jgi:hypothetical protein